MKSKWKQWCETRDHYGKLASGLTQDAMTMLKMLIDAGVKGLEYEELVASFGNPDEELNELADKKLIYSDHKGTIHYNSGNNN